MADLSQETQAIIARLKSEGELIRYRGKDSMRAVTIRLDKFENVFNTISSNITEQTKLLQTQAGIAIDNLETQRTQDQFDEVKAKAADDSNDDNRKDGEEKFSNAIGNGVKSLFSLNTLKNIALAAGGAFVGYNLLKGFIDDQTGGKFSDMEDSIANINWTSFSDAINTASASILSFSDWMDGLPALLIGGGIAGVGVRSAARGVADSLLGGGGGPRRGGALRGLTSIRTGILGAVTGLAIAYGDDVEDWLVNEMGVDPKVADQTVNIAKYALTGATLGSMFGPQGAIIGAAMGTAVGVGAALWDWIRNNQDRAIEEARKRTEKAYQILEEGGTDAEQAVALALETPEEAARRSAMEDPAQAPTREVVAAGNILRSNREDAVNEIINQLEGTGVFQAGSFTSDSLRDSLRSLKASEDVTQNPQIIRLVEDLRDVVGLSNEEIEAILLSIRNNVSDIDPRPIAGFRTGTKGFQDFGDGQFSVLHGKEAVVPKNTAAGRFLDQYFTDNWEPRIANSQKIQKVASGAESGGAVIISAPTNVSPVINNMGGNKSVNQLSLRTGGGGGGFGFGGANAYGLSGFLN